MNPYEAAADALLREADVQVVKWRSSTSGIAYDYGRRIECPRPRGPVSFGVLAHEVGHIVLGHAGRDKPRWQEEVEVWEYALGQVERFGLRGYEAVHRDASLCLASTFAKAITAGVDPEAIRDRHPTWWREARLADRWDRLERALARASARRVRSP